MIYYQWTLHLQSPGPIPSIVDLSRRRPSIRTTNGPCLNRKISLSQDYKALLFERLRSLIGCSAGAGLLAALTETQFP
jgi:hypothetical protein